MNTEKPTNPIYPIQYQKESGVENKENSNLIARDPGSDLFLIFEKLQYTVVTNPWQTDSDLKL